MEEKLKRINTAFEKLEIAVNSVREMTKKFLQLILTNTNKDNPMSVNILVGLNSEFGLAYYPILTKMWLQDNDIIFVIDDKEIEFDYIETFDLYTIINQI